MLPPAAPAASTVIRRPAASLRWDAPGLALPRPNWTVLADPEGHELRGVPRKCLSDQAAPRTERYL